MSTQRPSGVIDKIAKRHGAWFRYFRSWRSLFWACGVTAAAASALAAAELGKTSPYFALLSSLCIAVLGFTNPQRPAHAYATAWRRLGSALLRYEANECKLTDVILAVDQGEAAIAEVDVSHLGEPPQSSSALPT